MLWFWAFQRNFVILPRAVLEQRPVAITLLAKTIWNVFCVFVNECFVLAMWRHKWGLGSKYDWINLQNKRNKSLQWFLAILPASNRKCSWQTAQQGWRTAEVLPAEFGSGGSVATSGTGLQKQMGMQATALRQVTCIQGYTVKQRLRKKGPETERPCNKMSEWAWCTWHHWWSLWK